MDTVVYVDITREPVSWFLSMYAWRRFGSVEKPHTGKRHASMQVRGPTYREASCLILGERSYI